MGFWCIFVQGPSTARLPSFVMKKGEMHGPDGNFLDSGYGRNAGNLPKVFRCVNAPRYEGLIRRTDRRTDRQMNGIRVGCAQLGRN